MGKKFTRKQLPILQSSQLLLLVQAEYAASGLNDADFATYASKKLGFEVTENQVEGRREALGIPSTYAVKLQKRGVTIEVLLDMLEELTKRVNALEGRKE